jgi:hypothetical protein
MLSLHELRALRITSEPQLRISDQLQFHREVVSLTRTSISTISWSEKLGNRF